MTYRRILWSENENAYSQYVSNDINPNGIFDMYHTYNEYKETLYSGGNKTYDWVSGNGQYETGAYSDIFLGKMTITEALE
jgi:hypothetical protein